MPQIGSVDLDVSNGGWGGDVSLTDSGDIQLAEDSVLDPQATLQRVVRIMLTNARIFDDNGYPISEADDLFNVDFGASIRSLIGQMITPALLSGIKARVLAALSVDPGLVQQPAPVITVSAGSIAGSIVITGTVYLVTGNAAPLPTIIVPASGSPTILPVAA